MSKQFHTPGPWSITSDDGGDLHVTAPDATDPENPWNIAVVIASCGYRDDPRTGCTQANAHLVAAAPDLLSQLRFAVTLLRPWAGGTAQVQAMEAVIAKAEGSDQ